MRYTQKHKNEVRRKIVRKAGARMKDRGFAATGVDALMAESGLTSGAFYKHFESKEDLFLAVIESEMLRSQRMFDSVVPGVSTGVNTPEKPSSTVAPSLSAILQWYLHPAHVANADKGCVLPSLTPEIARASATVRHRFTQELQALHARAASASGCSEQAWAALSMAVGAVMLARATNDEAVRLSILKGCATALTTEHKQET